MTIDEASELVSLQAKIFSNKVPTLGTLMQEVAELTRSLEGKHSDPPILELIQIGSITINLMKNYELIEAVTALKERYG